MGTRKQYELLGTSFTIMVPGIPDEPEQTSIFRKQLPEDWKLESSFAITQSLGSA